MRRLLFIVLLLISGNLSAQIDPSNTDPEKLKEMMKNFKPMFNDGVISGYVF